MGGLGSATPRQSKPVLLIAKGVTYAWGGWAWDWAWDWRWGWGMFTYYHLIASNKLIMQGRLFSR